jgi:RND family efflux transporter MFP subunit
MPEIRLATAPRMRRIAAIGACLAALLGIGAAAAQGGAPQVSVAVPVLGKVSDYDEFTGRFEATERVTVQARVSGYLNSVHFQDGQLVNAGDLLYIIDPRPFDAAVARAQAALARAESQLTLGELDLARAERLLSSNAMAREEVDSRRATVRAAKADVDAAKADLRAASLQLEFTRVIAPVTGRVSSTLVDVGNLVTGGAGAATVLTSIVSRTPIYFTFDVSEADYLSYLRLSAAAGLSLDAVRPVHVKLLDETEWVRSGELDFVDNQFNQATGTIRMRASFSNTDGRLVPGIFGRLRLAASPEYEALMIPDRAILSDQSHKMVMVVDTDDVVQARRVEPGPLSGGLRVIHKGLQAADRVIVDGLLRARPGARVTPEIVSANRQ